MSEQVVASAYCVTQRYLLPFGLRTVDGSYNNIIPGQETFGAADEDFPLLLEQRFRNEGDDTFTFDFDGPGPQPPVTVSNNNYATTGNALGNVADADPRIISNLIVDQTIGNLAAVAAFVESGNGILADGVTHIDPITGLPYAAGTVLDLNEIAIPAGQALFIPNIAPDEGLSAPYNGWFAFFGQFFDHGLDLTNKGGNGLVFIPLQEDDPLFSTAPGAMNFMILTRATNTFVDAGTDNTFGTADDVHLHNNQTTPFVDQNQTYTSNPSHQVFLREYAVDGSGRPVITGKMLNGADGGLPTWANVKANALKLGIVLTDADVTNLPMVAVDRYGQFIAAANGMAQFATAGGLVPGVPGGLAVPANVIRTNHAFLDDIAHSAAPRSSSGALLTADSGAIDLLPNGIGDDGNPSTYDNELLDAHFITGDGRGNENIALTTVHTIFHAEHNRLVEHTKQVLVDDAQALLAGGATQAAAVAFLNQWLRVDVTTVPTDAQIPTLGWDGERLFQAARFGTEMQYQHLVFEEFARKVQPNIDAFLAPNGYDVTINPAIVAEFAHVVYRFGHSMLTETIDRYDPSFNVVGDANPTEAGNQQIGLIAAFLNPLAFAASGGSGAEAAGAIIRGMTRQVGNELDEFVTEALRNNLVGLPLDLPAINIARGRETGVPSLNAARAEFYALTGDSDLVPYTSWVDFAIHLKHQESVINFIAAYGTHASITGAASTDGGPASARFLDLRGLISAEEQRQMARVYLSAFLEATLRGRREYLPLFRDHRVVGGWLPKTMYITRFSENRFRPLARFDEDVNVTTEDRGHAGPADRVHQCDVPVALDHPADERVVAAVRSAGARRLVAAPRVADAHRRRREQTALTEVVLALAVQAAERTHHGNRGVLARPRRAAALRPPRG